MNMARSIRETPILVGKDAERFVKEMKRVESLLLIRGELIERNCMQKSKKSTKSGT